VLIEFVGNSTTKPSPKVSCRVMSEVCGIRAESPPTPTLRTDVFSG